MAKKNHDEYTPVRRSTYIEPSPEEATMTEETAETPQPSEELKQTIAEARAAQVEDLKSKLAEAESIMREQVEQIKSLYAQRDEYEKEAAELKQAPRGVSTGAYLYTSEETGEEFVVAQIDTDHGTGKIRVYVNDGIVYEGDPEQENAEEDKLEPENIEESAEARFFRIVQEYLEVQGSGPQAVLEQLIRRTPIERAAYAASVDSIADALEQNLANLRRYADGLRRAEVYLQG